MNLPNRLTMLRLILVPVIMLLLLPIPGCLWWNQFVSSPLAHILALIVFCIASISDFLDGKIARSRNLVTDFGKLFDPIADKLLVVGTFMAFVQLGRVHALILWVILFRELLITGIRQIAASKGKVIAASMLGKWKTVTQIVSLIWLLLEPILSLKVSDMGVILSIGNVLIAVAVVMTILSGYDYMKKNIHFFRQA